jgi:hypothetical protein
MAKRSRLGSRPGQRRPLQRTTAKPLPAAGAAPAPRPAGAVTPEEEARAAELEAQILAEEKAAENARKGRTQRTPSETPGEATIYVSAPLAQRAAEEYGYVRRDLRRIALLGGLLLLVMFGIDILLNVTNVI